MHKLFESLRSAEKGPDLIRGLRVTWYSMDGHPVGSWTGPQEAYERKVSELTASLPADAAFATLEMLDLLPLYEELT
jgi:hypothetical protein